MGMSPYGYRHADPSDLGLVMLLMDDSVAYGVGRSNK